MTEEAERCNVEDKIISRKAKVISALDSCVCDIKNIRNKGVHLMLTRKKSNDIDNAITKAESYLGEDNQEIKEIDVLEDNLKELKSLLKFLKAKTD